MNELFRTLLMLPPQASTAAFRIDVLHYVVIATAVLGLVLVIAATTWFGVRHRTGGGRPRQKGRGAPWWVEAFAVTGILGAFLVFWLFGAEQYLFLETPPANAMSVYVVGKQWMWSFAYSFSSASLTELVVPEDQPVKLVLTSRDVIHSFYIPAFRIKQDAVPGRATIVWFEAVEPGNYEILCAEYCGLSHSHMRGQVRVLRRDDYERWRQQQELRAPKPNTKEVLLSATARPRHEGRKGHALSDFGERVAAERGCLRCHTLDGTPHLGPTWAGLYRAAVPLEGGQSTVADEAYLTRSMMDPAADVHEGFAPVMPSYLGLLTPTDTAAIVELIRSLAGRAQRPSDMPLPVRTKATPTLPVQDESGTEPISLLSEGAL